jgi:hypothetical protein
VVFFEATGPFKAHSWPYLSHLLASYFGPKIFGGPSPVTVSDLYHLRRLPLTTASFMPPSQASVTDPYHLKKINKNSRFHKFPS